MKIKNGNKTFNIQEAAFGVCGNLGSLILPASLNYLGNNAFKDCVLIDTITCMSPTPPKLGTTVFQNIRKTIPLIVQPGSIDSYKAASQWKDFTKITEKSAEVPVPVNEAFGLYPNPIKESFTIKGIKGISTVTIYDMNGKTKFVKQVQPNEIIPVNELGNGLFIVRIVNDSISVRLKILKE